MNAKTPIVRFFAECLPEFQFVPDLRPNLIFRQLRPSGIYLNFAVQRDSAAHGLATVIACTYDPNWRGESALPLGISAALVNLRLGSRLIDAMLYWTFYEPTLDGLHIALKSIHEEFKKLAPPFFAESERRLASNPLIQAGLAEARRIPAAERVGLADAASTARVLRKLDHPAFMRVRDAVQAAWTPEVSKDERRWTSGIALRCLELPTE